MGMTKITAIIATLLLASSAFAGFSETSATSMKNSWDASVTLVKGSTTTNTNAVSGIYESMKTGVSGAGEFSVVAITNPSDTSAVILADPSAVMTASVDGVSTVVNNSGAFVSAHLDTSGQFIQTTVTASGTVITSGTEMVIGSVVWTSGKVKTSGKFLVDAAGDIWTFSKEKVGYVVDAAGNIVSFAFTGSKKLFTLAKDGSVLVITTGSKYLVKGAKMLGTTVVAIARGAGDVILTSAATSVASTGAALNGDFLKASEILVYLPANMLRAAVYSDMHYQSIEMK